MLLRHCHIWLCAIYIAAWPKIAAGQSIAASAATQQATAVALRIDPPDSIAVDGVLDEAAWERAEPIGNFTQSEPRNGEHETERTEIRILFNGDNLYIGAQFFDSEPDGLLGNQMVRDGSLGADDRFMWVLDPFNDQRSGYFFEINPAGRDGRRAARSGRRGGTTGGMSQNRAWDGIWMARVRRHDQGWTAEVEIPFRTLNFDPEAAGVGRELSAHRQAQERREPLDGMGPESGDLQPWRRRPHRRNQRRQPGPRPRRQAVRDRHLPRRDRAAVVDSTKATTGLDFFYSLTPQLKPNLTINTDFAQTEVDDRQVNLTRFPLFFPEKRDFFLEGSGNFDFSREARERPDGVLHAPHRPRRPRPAAEDRLRRQAGGTGRPLQSRRACRCARRTQAGRPARTSPSSVPSASSCGSRTPG